MKNILLLILMPFCVLLGEVKAQENQKNNDIEYEVQFLRTGLEGTILFKIFSYGRSEEECIQNGKKNAIRAVLFSGIPGSDLQRPLITQPGMEDLYKDYFDAFFKRNGKYLRFVSLSTDGTIDSQDRIRIGNRIKVGIAVLVQKAALRNELESVGIIKKLSEGF